MLGDPDVKVRREATRSLCTIGGQQVLPALIIASKQADEEQQWRAVSCLVDFYVPGYYRTGLSGALRNAGSSIKGRFTDVNDALLPPGVTVRPEVLEAVRRVAQSGITLTARVEGTRAVGVLRDRGSLPQLYAALKSKESDLIYESLVAIRKIGDRDSAPQVWFLLRDLEPKVRLEAMEITGIFQNREAIPRLRQTYDEGDKRYKEAAFQALVRMPDKSMLQMIEDNLNGTDPELRALAAEGLGRLGDATQRARLRTMYDAERKMEPRLALAFALVKLGDRKFAQLEPLTDLLNTLNSAMYKGVAEAYLMELANEPAFRSLLGNQLPSMNQSEKLGTLRILAARGESESLAPLEFVSKDQDPLVAREALRALNVVRARAQ